MVLKLIESVTTKTENGLVFGYNVYDDGSKIPYMTVKDPLWFSMTTRDKWNVLGFPHISLYKIKEFELITERYPIDAIYYLDFVAGEDKLKYGEPVFNWLLGPMLELMNELYYSQFKQLISGIKLHEFIYALVDGKFNKAKAKEAFKEFLTTLNIDDIINNKKYQMADLSVIDNAITKVISNNPDVIEKIKKDARLINWLVGQVMKECQGKANALDVKEKIVLLTA